MTHTLPELGYAYDALEPYIDAKTMEIHHSKHHQSYVNKLNTALEGHPELQENDLLELIKNINNLPEDVRSAVRNNGGGHANHSFFWPLLKKDVKPEGEILESINEKFGSIENFKDQFSQTAATVFGSGWVWLVVNNGKLEIVKTSNQDSPISKGKIPLLTLDIWEHSYYVKYFWNRPAYIEAWWNVVNWNKVNEHFLNSR